MVLNYKNIPYETQWVEYPDIEPTLSPHVPANPPGNAAYTIPTVQFTDGSYVMDSAAINSRLEKEHPNPSLHFDSPILPEATAILGNVRMSLLGHWMPFVPDNLLNAPSKEYFIRTREEKFKKSLSQLHKDEGTEEAWEKATPELKRLGDLLKKEGGPFFMGETTSYTDFVIVSFLQFFKAIDQKLLFDRVVGIEPALGKLYDASKQWLEREDY